MRVRDVTDTNNPGDWQDIPAGRHIDAAVTFAKRFEGLRTPMPNRVEVRAAEHSVSAVYAIKREITATPVDPHAS